MIDEIFENNQQDPDICDFSDFNYNIYKLQYSEVQKPRLTPAATLENISKVFTLDTEKEKPSLSSIDDEFEPHLYSNKNTKSLFILESDGILNIIDSKEKSISMVFEPEENKEILPMKILDIQNEKVEEIIPSSNKIDRINAVSKNFDHIFKILSKINYPEEKIKEIKEDIITQKDIENIWLFEVKTKKNKDENKNKNKDKIKSKAKTAIKKKEKEEIKESKEVKYGRKSNNNEDDVQGSHGKDCPDNIIKKIKAFFFSSVIEYVQKFINIYKQNLDNDIKLLTLDYKNVNKLEKKFNIEILKTPLKDLISREISSRYRNQEHNKGWNKKIIDNVLVK